MYNENMTIPRFQKIILDWHKKNRRDMPWRKTKDPYKILVSEVMLQQTQVVRVLPKYKEFLKEFPILQSLAKTPDKKLLKVWQGLGYWKRALSLKQAVKEIIKSHKGKFPKNPGDLQKLPGIGPYTAHAVSCFAFKNSDAFLDTNIRRVYLHFFFPKRTNVSDKEILKVAEKATVSKNSREWHYALFDYGALVLKDKKINRQSKHYAKQSRFEGSFRFFRTKVMRFLLDQPQSKTKKEKVESFLERELQKNKSIHASNKILEALIQNKLIKRTKDYYSI